jgi:hypothetical protein
MQIQNKIQTFELLKFNFFLSYSNSSNSAEHYSNVYKHFLPYENCLLLPSDLLFLLNRQTKAKKERMHNKGNTKRSYLSDVNPHNFYFIITIIMMMIEKKEYFENTQPTMVW